MLHLPECILLLDKLQNSLPPYIYYHTVEHTLDVYHTAILIAAHEQIQGAELKLLGISAVFHDCGYLEKSIGHEEISCHIVKEILPTFNYQSADVDVICGIIRATKVPQKPTTILQKIICDADMDYLGRDDFFNLGDQLFKEFHEQKMVTNKLQWDRLQIDFLKEHQYFTQFAIDRRQQTKDKNLAMLKSKLSYYER
ncbi:MAG TPA: HD domain-containing protein [Flavobacterium sp.]|nr:HD domain-containing protein [Flavobacterium sp.]